METDLPYLNLAPYFALQWLVIRKRICMCDHTHTHVWVCTTRFRKPSTIHPFVLGTRTLKKKKKILHWCILIEKHFVVRTYQLNYVPF